MADFNIDHIEKELSGNKDLIKRTTGRDNGESSGGSDSEPSADNMEEEELAQVVPVKPKPKPVEDPKKLKKLVTQKISQLITTADRNKRQAPNSPEVKTRQKVLDGMTPAQKAALTGIKKQPMVSVYDRMRNKNRVKPETRDVGT